MGEPSFKIETRARRQGKTDETRRRLYGAIRAACGRLGIDDDERKDMQADLVGKSSMSDMSMAELGKLLDHLNRNWKGPMGHRSHIGKIKALWWSLYWLGEIDDPDDRALSAFVKRQTKVSSLRFLDHGKAPSVIEALKAWLERTGVVWPTAASTAAITAGFPSFTPALHERHAVLGAVARALSGRGEIQSGYTDYMQRTLGLTGPAEGWTAHELDAGIRHMGRMLRRSMPLAAGE